MCVCVCVQHISSIPSSSAVPSPSTPTRGKVCTYSGATMWSTTMKRSPWNPNTCLQNGRKAAAVHRWVSTTHWQHFQAFADEQICTAIFITEPVSVLASHTHFFHFWYKFIRNKGRLFFYRSKPGCYYKLAVLSSPRTHRKSMYIQWHLSFLTSAYPVSRTPLSANTRV